VKEKLILYISFLVILLGLIKFDILVYPTLDYFGKYVFFIALNIMPFYIANLFFNIKNKKLAYFLTLFWGIGVGVIFYTLSIL